MEEALKVGTPRAASAQVSVPADNNQPKCLVFCHSEGGPEVGV